MIDITRELRTLVTTGKVLLGADQAKKALKSGTAKLVIVASNVSKENAEAIAKFEGAPVYRFPGTSLELGSACGKPFAVSVLTVLNPGESQIMSVLK
ncbi:MAG: 50S ribosomal protein L30e [Thermoplasmata archaeon]